MNVCVNMNGFKAKLMRIILYILLYNIQIIKFNFPNFYKHLIIFLYIVQSE